MLKKLAIALGMLALVFGVVGVFGSGASAHHQRGHFGPAKWRTEDGKYELTLRTTSAERNVWVQIWDVYRVNHRTKRATQRLDYSSLFVRLCSASTGNCTSFKKFNGSDGETGAVKFTKMIPGTYRVDIVDSRTDYYYRGRIDAFTW
ncbi:MAG: hypothetical protein DIU69_07080 [Bacillota bacterium]|nr:MAG: hypothetical protein DIU69_07080 [Bacillota bacterium]